MWMWQETLLPNFVKLGVNLKFLHLGYHGNGCHFEFFQPPKAATHDGGYSYKVSWSMMKGIQFFFKFPVFCFHDNCSKVCPSNLLWSFLCFNFFLHFCRFHGNGSYFEKINPLTAQLHIAYDIPIRFHNVWSRHLREIVDKNVWKNNNNKNNRIAIHHPTAVGVM